MTYHQQLARSSLGRRKSDVILKLLLVLTLILTGYSWYGPEGQLYTSNYINSVLEQSHKDLDTLGIYAGNPCYDEALEYRMLGKPVSTTCLHVTRELP